jgi:hypothetical protein
MFFILRDHYSIKEIAAHTQNIFGQLFFEKLFREQLAFHKDIDYTEPVTFMVNPVSDEEIKKFLTARTPWGANLSLWCKRCCATRCQRTVNDVCYF